MQGETVGLYKYLLNLHAAMGFLMAKYPPPPDFDSAAGPGCVALSGKGSVRCSWEEGTGYKPALAEKWSRGRRS